MTARLERVLGVESAARPAPRPRSRARFRVQKTLLAAFLASAAAVAEASRIEELCDIRGVRPNQLIGYGLVVGLNGTGDSGQARFTVQSTAAMLRRLGATIDPTTIQTKNAAAVVVTATLPPFANPGTRIDVAVSSLGNARSLQGGTLVQTPLHGADREVYAVAQGPLLLGGFSAEGGSGSGVQNNHVTVGRVPAGAIVERRVAAPALNRDLLVFTLRDPNFVTAQRIVDTINAHVAPNISQAVDSGTIRMRVPPEYRGQQVGLIANVQMLSVTPNAPARVVIDERSGTIVLGTNVRISEVAIAQGGLTVEIRESFAVSQPNPFGEGTTEVVPESEVRAEAATGSLQRLQGSANLADVVTALNALGARPRDLVAIFQALRTAGALQAEIELQ
ncbi:MAG: flagellar basal body P-ring protein FlgI [Myxococcota bacterium]